MGKKERVILIKGDSSQWYEQAIFIVNQNIPQEKIPVDFVSEAEKIVNTYIKKRNGQNVGPSVGVAYAASNPAVAPIRTVKAPKNKKMDFIINTILFFGCIFIASVIAFGLLS